MLGPLSMTPAIASTASANASSVQSLPQTRQTVSQIDPSLCPDPVLERLTQHRIQPGETLASIAAEYDLIPATLMGLNPALRNGAVPVGATILIPPYNGIRVQVPQGQTWQDVAQAYNTRADVLFEANGCQAQPRTVFIPGVNWSPNLEAPIYNAETASQPHGVLRGYPLPDPAPVILSYGWQTHPTEDRAIFSSGIGLEAAAGTTALAVADGTVAFVGEDNNFGQIVVVNHAEGLQTRYAQLADVTVETGQPVRQGTPLGKTRSQAAVQPYLYFEIRSNSALGWVAEDPQRYIPSLRVR